MTGLLKNKKTFFAALCLCCALSSLILADSAQITTGADFAGGVFSNTEISGNSVQLTVTPTPDNWWNTSWAYRKAISIDNQSGSALSDFQVKIANPVYDETSLVGSWHFEEGTGTSITDSAGNTGTGTMTIGGGGTQTTSTQAWTNGASGKYGSALNFDGTDDYVSTGSISNMNISGEISVEAWIYPKTVSVSQQSISSRGGGWSRAGWLLTLNNNVFRWHLGNGGSEAYFDTATTVAVNTWTHVVGQWRNGTLFVYINGVRDRNTASWAAGAVTNSYTHYIGRTDGGATFYYNGMIDEVRVYNRALSPEEIKAHYEAKAKLNYGDMRFTNSSGTELPYWIEKDGAFWLKIPGSDTIPSGLSTIYTYYGNPSASTTGTTPDNIFLRVIDGTQPLKGSWNLDEGTGTTTADSSGNGKTGTLTSSPVWTTGKFGKGLTTSGNAYISIASLDIANEWTIESWFLSPMPAPAGNWTTLTRGSNDHQVLAYEGRDLGTYDNATGTAFHDSSWDINTLPAGWHHLAAVGKTDGNTYFYIDGTYMAFSNFRSTADIVALGNYQGGGQAFGTFDELRIYNRALLDAEITDLYNNYGYSTPAYPGRVLIRKYVSTMPVTAFHAEQENMKFGYQKSISLNNTTGATLTNFQVKVIANYNTTVAGQINMEAHCKSDFNDVRFGDDTGKTYPYWRESWTYQNKATFWVKIPSIPASGTTIYAYYGNASAADNSNGTAVFDFFDDFTNNALDTSKWTSSGTVTSYPGYISISSGAYVRSNVTANSLLTNSALVLEGAVIHNSSTNANMFGMVTSNYFGSAEMSTTSAGVSILRWTNNNYYFERANDSNQGTETIQGLTTTSSLNRLTIKWVKGTSMYYEAPNNAGGTYTLTASDYVPNTSSLYIHMDTTTNTSANLDYVFVRKYASTDPAITATGTEAAWNTKTGAWSKGDTYRITNSNSYELRNTQVSLTVDTATLISQGYMNSDCSDLRFTDTSDTAEEKWDISYPYWIESGINTSSTKIWVKVDYIGASTTKDIYLFCNNPGATAGTNGTLTFDFFDDFFGTSVNNSIWTLNANSYTVSGGEFRINTGAARTTNLLPFNLNSGYVLEGRVTYYATAVNFSGTIAGVSSTYTQGGNAGSDATVLYMKQASSNDVYTWIGSGSAASYNIASAVNVFTSVLSTPYILGIKFHPNGSILTKDYSAQRTDTFTWSKNAVYITLGQFDGTASADIQDTGYDWVRVRKYSATEPSTSYQGAIQVSNSGTYVSPRYEINENTSPLTLDSVSYTVSGTGTLTAYFRASNTDTDFTNFTDDTGWEMLDASPDSSITSQGKYFQFKTSHYNPSQSNEPKLDDFTLSYTCNPSAVSATINDIDIDNSLDTVTITFDEPITGTTSITAGTGFSLSGFVILSGVLSSADTITFTIGESGTNDAESPPGVITYDPSTGNITDTDGTANSVLSVQNTPLTNNAVPNPRVLSAVTSDTNANGQIDSLRVSFSEPVTGTNSVLIGAGFDLQGYTIASGTLGSPSDSILFTLTESGSTDYENTPDLSYTTAQGDMVDTDGSTADTLQTYSAAPVSTTAIVTSLSYMDTNGNGYLDLLIFTFSRELSNTGEISDWLIIDADGTTILSQDLTDSSMNYAQDKLFITLADNSGTKSKPGYTYLPDGTSDLTDISGTAIYNMTSPAEATPPPEEPSENLPTANAGPDQVSAPAIITLDGSASYNPLTNSLTYSWTQKSGPVEVVLTDAATANPFFVAKKSGSYVFQLTVGNGIGFDSDLMKVLISNVPPVADVGMDVSVIAGTQVILDGSNSVDPNETALTYLWTPAELLLNSDTATPTLDTTSLNGVYEFTLAVSDGIYTSDPVAVTVIVNSESNLLPYADAGSNISTTTGTAITLDASGSVDSDGAIAAYTWTLLSGPETVSLTSTALPSFTPAVDGVYEFQLVVTDGQGSDSIPDTVLVYANSATNNIPTAIATADNYSINVLDSVTLSSEESVDLESPAVTAIWEQTAGPQIFTGTQTSQTINFSPVEPGTYTFRLIVNDGLLASYPDYISINVAPEGTTVYPAAVPAISSANDPDADSKINIYEFSTVMLDSSASAGTGTLSYSWIQTSGPTVLLNSSDTASPYFSPAVSGIYEFQLTVIDDNGLADTNTVTIAVDTYDAVLNPSGNLLPSANAGTDSTVFLNSAVTLNGSGSNDSVEDPDGVMDLFSGLSFQWVQTAGPLIALNNANTYQPGFIASKTGLYSFNLYVSDGLSKSLADTVTITVVSGTAGGNDDDGQNGGDQEQEETKTSGQVGSVEGNGCFLNTLKRK